jgi:hypothetical protein
MIESIEPLEYKQISYMFSNLPFYAAEHHRIDRNRSLTCLSVAIFQTPGRFEERRAVTQRGTK